jgi:hypothetical protein
VANLKKVGIVSGFIKKSKGFPVILTFSRISQNCFCIYRKSHGSSLWNIGPRLAFGTWWTRNHGAARPLRGSGGRHDSSERERERRSSGFSLMAPLETELRRWPRDDAQHRRPVVL